MKVIFIGIILSVLFTSNLLFVGFRDEMIENLKRNTRKQKNNGIKVSLLCLTLIMNIIV